MSSRRLMVESLIVTVTSVALFRLVYYIPIVGRYGSTAVPILLIYIPIFISGWRKHPLALKGDGWKSGVISFVAWSLIIFPIFVIAAHFWQRFIYNEGPFHLAAPPAASFWLAQLVAAALPEEIFFRGYLQTCLDKFFIARWNIFGVRLGWAWPLTALIFAFAHSVITYRWWHFAIFFPALVFGYLRERTGGIIAPTLFHASSNIVMAWFVSCY